jgi:hypothetical protein
MVRLSCKQLVVDAATEVHPDVEQQQPSNYSFPKKQVVVVVQTCKITPLFRFQAFRHSISMGDLGISFNRCCYCCIYSMRVCMCGGSNAGRLVGAYMESVELNQYSRTGC